MTRKGVRLLPPVVTQEQAVALFRKLADVNMLLGNMKGEFRHSVVGGSVINLFALYESVESTRIEGTQVTFSDMIDPPPGRRESWERREVVNYQKALRDGLNQIAEGVPFSTRMLLRLHKILMTDARGTRSAGGEFRKIQNFIGPDNKIEHASYIPVGANEIPAYMENLEYYMNGVHHDSFARHDGDLYVLDESVSPLLKLAIMHAQFESIHPFLDGNGRLGRILIALMAVKEGIVDKPVFLVSEELERERSRYYDMLNGVRGEDPDWYPWLDFFIGCCGEMARRLLKQMQASIALFESGFRKLERETDKRAWGLSFACPRLAASDVSSALKVSQGTARRSLKSLAEKGLLFTPKDKQRKRAYFNYDLMSLFK